MSVGGLESHLAASSLVQFPYKKLGETRMFITDIRVKKITAKFCVYIHKPGQKQKEREPVLTLTKMLRSLVLFLSLCGK